MAHVKKTGYFLHDKRVMYVELRVNLTQQLH